MTIDKYIKPKIAIQCTTYKSTVSLMSLLSNTYTIWRGMGPYSVDRSCRYWDRYKEDTVIYPYGGVFSSLEYFTEWVSDFKIIKFEDLEIDYNYLNKLIIKREYARRDNQRLY